MATRNPGYNLSRECIRDTLQSKRDGSYKQSGLCFALYNTNICTLRSTQLAPYSEVMRAGRYMQTMLMKRTAPDIVVVIRGGLVQEVRSTNPFTSVMIANYDRNNSDYQDMFHLPASCTESQLMTELGLSNADPDSADFPTPQDYADSVLTKAAATLGGTWEYVRQAGNIDIYYEGV